MQVLKMLIFWSSVWNSLGYGFVEDKLLGRLFEGYDKDARPVIGSVQVDLQFYLHKLYDVDLKEQVFHTAGYIIQKWNDPRLIWNSSESSKVTSLAVEDSRVWTPDIALINAIDALFDAQHTNNIKVEIEENGNITKFPGGSYASSCDIDITYFPFDEQVCHLIFGSWIHTEKKMNLSVLSSKVLLERYSEHAEWSIMDTYAHRYNRKYNCCPGHVYAGIRFVIHLKRKPLYFLFHIVVPSIFLSVLVVIIFTLPPDSGEKISLGITVLLSFSVFMFMIAEKLPRSSDTVPLLGIYLAFFMAMSTLAVVLSVIVLKMYHHDCDSRAPAWMRKLMLSHHGHHFCCKSSHKQSITESFNIPKDLDDLKARDISEQDTDSNNTGIEMRGSARGKMDILTNAGQTEITSSEWKEIAKVMDRCFSILFSIMFLTVATFLLGVMPYFQPKIDLKVWTPK